MSKERQITSVPIAGLDLSSPYNMAKKGSCSELHNLRYQNNAWRPVAPLTTLNTIVKSQANLMRLLYHHPVCPEHIYIAMVEQDGMADIAMVELSDSNTEDILNNRVNLITDVSTGFGDIWTSKVTVSHYGNVLIILVDGDIHYFLWDSEALEYSAVEFPEPVTISEEYSTGVMAPSLIAVFSPEEAMDIYALYNGVEKTEIYPTNDGNGVHWWGELCYLVCYKMTDGSIISPSELRILCSEGNDSEEYKVIQFTIFDVDNTETKGHWGLARRRAVEGTQPYNTTRLRRFLPTISIEVPANINTKLIDRVAIYATRINPIFDYGKLTDEQKNKYCNVNVTGVGGFYIDDVVDTNAYQVDDVYADNKLPEQPFYLVAEEKIANIYGNSNVWEFDMGYDKLKNLTSQVDIYEPNQSLHTIVPQVLYEYNNRLHLANTTTKLFKGFNNFLTSFKSDEYVNNPFYQILFDNGVGIENVNDLNVNAASEDDMTVFLGGKMISYPDFRATQIRFYHYYTGGGKWGAAKALTLSPATANNYAYYIIPPTNAGKYSNKIKYSSTIFERPVEPKSTIEEPNRIQLSALGNCLSLPFDASYSVGNAGDVILALNTVVEMLADYRFGETPLYVFTNNGIWAAIVGSGEVVYGNWAFINLDRISSPVTVAMNGNVFYITDRGVHALQGRKGVLISQAIESQDGTINVKTMWPHYRHNELVVTTDKGDKDFVFSLDSSYWSTRQHCGNKLNIAQCVEDSGDNIIIYDSENESGTADILITTRPFELTPMRITRLEALWARFDCGRSGQQKNIKIEGCVAAPDSEDSWHTLHSVTAYEREFGAIKGSASSARWYRITVGMNGVDSQMWLSNFDIEFYTRFLRRLR